MINIIDKAKCCGCNACGDVCTHGAITFNTDIEGFWYPVVNEDKCVDCGLCEKVCPILNIGELKRMTFHNLCAMLPNIKIWRSYLILLPEVYFPL